MSAIQRIKQQVGELQTIAGFQRFLRLGLRIFWLGLGGILAGWGFQALTGRLPNPLTWILLGALFALYPALVLIKSFIPHSRWTWKLDRLLGLQEQVSTAWQVAETSQPDEMSGWLISDVHHLLPQIRERMLRRGWHIKFDLVAALIVVLLSGVVLASQLIRPVTERLGELDSTAFDIPAPPQLSQEQAQENQPAPGEPSEEGDSAGPGQPGESPAEGMPGEGQSGQEPGGEGQPDMGAVTDALRQMGSDLSKQAGTYPFGQALENLDLAQAAEALEDLNSQLGDLSTESRNNLAEAMEEAARALQEAGEQQLSQDLQEAAEALARDDTEANQALDEVAGDLRQMAGGMETAELDAPDQESQGASSPEPLNRMAEEGGELELPLDEAAQSDLLNRARLDAAGSGVAGGSLDSLYQPGGDVAQTPLLPNSYLWKWQDVVSEYFQH